MMIMIGIVLSYLLGSIPTAYIYGKLYKQIDIREHGSGNVGATNVFRVLGKVPGIVVLLIDILKGYLTVAVVGDFLGLIEVMDRIWLAVAVVCGHNWTIFLNFKGGKGIATSLGVLIGFTVKISSIQPVLIGALGIWLVCFFITAFVSLSSILASVALPVLMLATHQPIELMVLGVVFAVFVVVRHRPNIKRLLEKKEPKVPLPFHKKRT